MSISNNDDLLSELLWSNIKTVVDENIKNIKDLNSTEAPGRKQSQAIRQRGKGSLSNVFSCVNNCFLKVTWNSHVRFSSTSVNICIHAHFIRKLMLMSSVNTK